MVGWLAPHPPAHQLCVCKTNIEHIEVLSPNWLLRSCAVPPCFIFITIASQQHTHSPTRPSSGIAYGAALPLPNPPNVVSVCIRYEYHYIKYTLRKWIGTVRVSRSLGIMGQCKMIQFCRRIPDSNRPTSISGHKMLRCNIKWLKCKVIYNWVLGGWMGWEFGWANRPTALVLSYVCASVVCVCWNWIWININIRCSCRWSGTEKNGRTKPNDRRREQMALAGSRGSHQPNGWIEGTGRRGQPCYNQWFVLASSALVLHEMVW